MLNVLTEMKKYQHFDYPLGTYTTQPVIGEWYTYEVARPGFITPVADGDYPNQAFQVWSKQGEYSTMVLDQVTVLADGGYIADTDYFDSLQDYVINQALTVTNARLTPQGQGQKIHGYVVLPPQNHPNGLLRFKRVE